jgi:hypothetical protein
MLSRNQKIHSQTHNPENKNKSCPSNTAKRRFNSSNATPKTKIPHSFVNSKRTKTKQKAKIKNQNTSSLSLSLSLSLSSQLTHLLTSNNQKKKKIQQQQEGKKERTNIRCDDASDKTDYNRSELRDQSEEAANL